MHKHPVFHQDEIGVIITFPEDWTVEDVKLFNDECLEPSVKFEKERIIELVYAAGVKVTIDENTTQRDVEAMEYAMRLLKNNIVSAIKGENK